MKTPTQAALAAKEIKGLLKSVYPNIKFSVKSDSFTGGDAVRIEYTDGPVYDDVENLVSKYEHGRFDSITDTAWSVKNKSIPQAKYVQVTRNKSEAARLTIFNMVKAIWFNNEDLYFDDYCDNAGLWVNVMIHREFWKTAF